MISMVDPSSVRSLKSLIVRTSDPMSNVIPYSGSSPIVTSMVSSLSGVESFAYSNVTTFEPGGPQPL